MGEGPGQASRTNYRPPRSALIFNIMLTVSEIGLSIFAYRLGRSAGLGETVAYLLASVVPVLGLLVYFARYRSFSMASALILGFSLFSALVALIGVGGAKGLLYKDSVVTGLIGLMFLASTILPKPIAFYFGQRLAAGGDAEGRRWWWGLWQYPGFRRSQYQITVVWAVAFLLEAVIKLIVITTTSFDQAFVISQILPFIAITVAMWLTIRIGNAAARQYE